MIIKLKTTFGDLMPKDIFTTDIYPKALFIKLCVPEGNHINAVNLINGYTFHFIKNTQVTKHKIQIKVFLKK